MTAAAPADLHILLLDPLFRLPDQPGATRSYDIGRRLTDAGHRVSILTTSAALTNEAREIDGMTVNAVQMHTRARFGHPPPDYISGAFARSTFWRIWSAAHDTDIVIATDRPVGLLPAVILFSFVRGIPWFLEVREGCPAPAAANAAFGQKLKSWIARAVFRWAARSARQIIALSRDIKDELTAQKIQEAKIVVSAPGCDTALFAAQPGTSTQALSAYPYLTQGMLVTYAGRMDGTRTLDDVLALAGAVQTIGDTPVNFALCGDGPARGKLEARALELGVLNKTLWFLDPLPRRALPSLLSASSAVIMGEGRPASRGSLSLFFDALAAGRPVVLTAPGWQKELIEGRGAGLGLPEGDIATAARELTDFLKDGDGLRRASQQSAALAAGRFNIERIAKEIRSVIEQETAADPRRAVMRRRSLRAKRTLDVVVSLAGLIVLSPVFLVLAILIRIKMGSPVLFTQTRAGLKGKLFRIYKFRTMTDARDAGGGPLSDEMRLTPLGRFMRRFSLDELPQLVNVLIGDMSLVGPRPLLPEYLPYYSAEQRRRHDVKPGVTGWLQINGRNALTWEEKFKLDVWYADNVSFWLDIKIILKTFWSAATGKGVSADDHATMPRFDEIMARRQGAEDV